MPPVQLRVRPRGADRRAGPRSAAARDRRRRASSLAVGQAQVVAGVAHQAEVAAVARAGLRPGSRRPARR